MPDPSVYADAFIAALSRKKVARSSSPKGEKKKFIWSGGCHECGADHYKKDCPKWQKLLKDNDGVMPVGHINAYSKARDAWYKKAWDGDSQSQAKGKT